MKAAQVACDLAPVVHLNGSGQEALETQWRDVVLAMQEATRALRRAAPNARDYYPRGDDAFERARRAFAELTEALACVEAACTAVFDDIDAQGDARRRQRR
jgi:hypothetical protein